jgi:hypothetical protein
MEMDGYIYGCNQSVISYKSGLLSLSCDHRDLSPVPFPWQRRATTALCATTPAQYVLVSDAYIRARIIDARTPIDREVVRLLLCHAHPVSVIVTVILASSHKVRLIKVTSG